MAEKEKRFSKAQREESYLPVTHVARMAWSKDIVSGRAGSIRRLVGGRGVMQMGGMMREKARFASKHFEGGRG